MLLCLCSLLAQEPSQTNLVKVRNKLAPLNAVMIGLAVYMVAVDRSNVMQANVQFLCKAKPLTPERASSLKSLLHVSMPSPCCFAATQ